MIMNVIHFKLNSHSHMQYSLTKYANIFLNKKKLQNSAAAAQAYLTIAIHLSAA